MNEFTVCVTSWNEAKDQLAAVRRAVFIEEQKVPEELEWDGEDEAAIHVLASDAFGNPIGSGRLLIHSQRGHIGRMAVLKTWRNRKVGSAILQTLMDAAQVHGCEDLFLNAQTDAMPFYARFDFRPEGEEFLDAGIPHYRMNLHLAGKPPQKHVNNGRYE